MLYEQKKIYLRKRGKQYKGKNKTAAQKQYCRPNELKSIAKTKLNLIKNDL
jgi:hypothetical protein